MPCSSVILLIQQNRPMCFLKMPWCDPSNWISIYLIDFFQLFFPTPTVHLMNVNNLKKKKSFSALFILKMTVSISVPLDEIFLLYLLSSSTNLNVNY